MKIEPLDFPQGHAIDMSATTVLPLDGLTALTRERELFLCKQHLSLQERNPYVVHTRHEGQSKVQCQHTKVRQRAAVFIQSTIYCKLLS